MPANKVIELLTYLIEQYGDIDVVLRRRGEEAMFDSVDLYELDVMQISERCFTTNGEKKDSKVIVVC